jgi:serine/threonine protein kinase/tetratricopeptide (TPR) repeat protein
MSPDDWAEVKELFSDLVDTNVPARQARLESVEPGVRRHVEWLLENHDAAEASGSFLRQPLVSERMAEWLLEPRVFEQGQILAGRFEIVRALGCGGMGEVYEAKDHQLREPVAIKTVRLDLIENQVILERFRLEVQRARKVTHFGVCRVHELYSARSFDDRDVPFFTMELLGGPTLYEYVAQNGALKPDRARPLAIRISEGLDAAHQCGLIHRDLKSSNIIMVSSDSGSGEKGAGPTAKITDFGLARMEGADTDFVRSAALSGTLPYMAPELLDGRPATIASDIYALGVVLYRMVTHAYPPAPGAFEARSLPAAWSQVIRACLESEPARRPKTAKEVARLLNDGASRSKVSRRVLLSAVAVSTATLLTRQWYRQDRKALRPEKSIVLVEDFESSDPGAALGRAARNLARIALRRVPGLTILGPDKVKAASVALNLGTAPLRGANAVHLATSAGAAITIAGKIQQRGSALDLNMRATDVKGSSTLASVSEAAANQRELGPAVGRACERMCQALFGVMPTGPRDLEPADTEDPQALELFTAGLSYYESGDSTNATAMLESATKRDPEFALAFVYQAYSLSAMLRDDLAYPAAKRAFELRDRVNERQRRQAEALFFYLSGDYERSLNAQRALVAMFPNEAPLHRHVAQLFAFLDRADEGIADGRAAVDLDPTPLNSMILASALAQAERGQEARMMIARGRSIPSKAPLLSLSECFLKLEEGDATGAISAAQEAIRSPDLETEGRAHEAQCLIFLGRLNEAQRNLQAEQVRLNSVGDGPNEDSAHYVLGLLAALWGQRKEVLAHAAVLLSRPATPPSLNSLRWGVEITSEVGGSQQMAQALEKIRKIDTAHRSSRSTGILFQAEGLAAGALGDAETCAVKLRDACAAWGDISNSWALAGALLESRNWGGALERYRRILSRRGASIRWRQQLYWVRSLAQVGRCYRALGDTARAVESYDRFLSCWRGQSDLPLVGQVAAERF